MNWDSTNKKVKFHQQELDSYSLSEEYCKKILQLNPQEELNFISLHEQFIKLSKKYHPDTNSDNRAHYSLVTLSYDYLKDLLQKNLFTNEIASSMNGGKLTPSYTRLNSIKTQLTKEESLLNYTIHYDWLDVFASWRQNLRYFKEIGYFFNKKCICQELCRYCRGSGVVLNSGCGYCATRGWVHYCTTCQGQGTYMEKDYCDVFFNVEEQIPKQKIYPRKGDQVNSHVRSDLLLTFKEKGVLKRKKDNLFIYELEIQPWQLKEPKLEVYLDKFSTWDIDTREIKKIPHYVNISSNFDFLLNKSKVKVFLKISLLLRS